VAFSQLERHALKRTRPLRLGDPLRASPADRFICPKTDQRSELWL